MVFDISLLISTSWSSASCELSRKSLKSLSIGESNLSSIIFDVSSILPTPEMNYCIFFTITDVVTATFRRFFSYSRYDEYKSETDWYLPGL